MSCYSKVKLGDEVALIDRDEPRVGSSSSIEQCIQKGEEQRGHTIERNQLRVRLSM